MGGVSSTFLIGLVVARLILHIGQTKTATTTIQAFLHGNQKQLADWGVHYLARPDRARSHRFVFHVLQLETYGDQNRLRQITMERLIAQGMASPGQEPAEVIEHVWSLLSRSLDTAANSTAVLSEELLWHLGGFRRERRFPLLHTLRHRLQQLLDPHDLLVVACLRHHADWAESWHNQLVKDTGNQTPIAKFAPYLWREGAFRYAENLADWKAVFPEAEFIVQDFHSQLLMADPSPGLALLHACGVLRELPAQERENLVQPERLQEAIHPFVHHWITRHQPPGASLKQYKRKVRRLSRQIGRVAERQFGEQRFTILTPELATKLTSWAEDDPLSGVMGKRVTLLSRIPERQTIPRPLPRRVRQLCTETFESSQDEKR